MTRRNKYRAKRAEMDGKKFDSCAEMRRYCQLKQLQLANEIEDLRLQESFPIEVNGIKCGSYRADFSYVDRRTGDTVYEDVKGYPTPLYKLKKKLVEAIHGIEIVEVRA